MTSLLRVQANRLNALQSTGPRTTAGKAASSANSLKHGLRRWKPTLLPGESAVQWKKFAVEIFDDLQPCGPVQMMWAGRIAFLMWKLRSTAGARKLLLDQQWREAEVLAPQSIWWQHLRKTKKRLPATMNGVRDSILKSKREQALLTRVAALPETPGPEADRQVDAITAADLIGAAAEHLGAEDQLTDAMNAHNRYPGVGSLTNDPDPELYEWTLRNVLEGLTEVAAWNHETCQGLIATMRPSMQAAGRALKATRRRGAREMCRFRRCSTAKSPETFEKYDRYEAGLERSLAQALSQLKSLQSTNPEHSSTNPEQTSQNVVQLGFVSLETPVKQA